MALFLAVLLTFAMPVMVLANELAATIGDVDAIQLILAQLTSGKLAGLSGVAAGIQVIMIALRSNTVVKMLGETKAQVRLALVLVLSYVGGMLALIQGGMEPLAAFFHSSSLAAFQVAAHQVYTVFVEKKAKQG